MTDPKIPEKKKGEQSPREAADFERKGGERDVRRDAEEEKRSIRSPEEKPGFGEGVTQNE